MSDALPLQQHPLYLDAVKRIGGEVHIVSTPDAAPIGMITRRFGPFPLQGLVSRGPIWRTPDADRRITTLRHMRKRGLRLVTSEGGDETALRRAGFRQILTPIHTACLSLTGSPEDRRAAMKGKWRNRLTRAERAGLTLHSANWRGADHWLLQAEQAQQRQRGYRALPLPLLAAMAQTKGAARLFEAIHHGQPVAGMLILRHGPIATYQTAWTGPKGRELNAHTLLLAHAAEWLARRGHQALDLGPVDTDANPGLARFKLGSGAQVKRGGGTWLALPFF